ncbi:hypothetical protein B0H12DRAFT_1231769 [Mycena haematopus]|nr:hypothetical protein B0H12DRAFT_1231769 [Mycena haematopus]
MTEYDSSPEAYHQFQRTQQRIAHWADDTAHCASQYKSPFLPRSDVQDNAFYTPRSASPSSSRSPTPSGHHRRDRGRASPHRSNSHGYPPAHPTPGVRSPLRSHTIAVDVVSPRDSISQVSGPSHHSSRRRAKSHSPTRHHGHSSSSRSHRSHHRSPPPPTTYAPAPQYPGVQYGYPNYGVQYGTGVVPVQYVQAHPAAYTVVYPSDRKVQIVYPPAAHPTQEHHSSGGGGLLRRIFGSQSGKHGRSRSVSVSRR